MKTLLSLVMGAAAAAALVLGALPAGGAQGPPRIVPWVDAVTEGEAGSTTTVDVPVALSAPAAVEVTVQWETIPGSGLDPARAAEPGVDYTPASGMVTFDPGVTDQTVPIEVLGDGVAEGDELIIVRFHSPSNAVIGGFLGLGVGEILDDDESAITVVPASGLAGGDVVTVSGTGFPADSTAGLCQADAAGADPPEDACRSGTGGAVSTPVDAAGEFSVEYTLTRLAFIPARVGFIDCADPATPCVVGAASIIDNQPVGSAVTAPLPFATPPPPPATLGQITVDPEADIVDGDTLTVTGSGFRPDAVVELHPCVEDASPPAGCDYAKRVNTVADGSGAFVATVPAHQFLYGTGVDCRLSQCVVGAGEAVDVPGTFVTAPISFEPTVPVIAPWISSVVEGDAGGTTVVDVPVMLSEPTSAEVTVQWEVLTMPLVDPALIATPGVDFVDASGQVTFGPNDIDEVVPITVNGDDETELDELIVVRFHSPTNATLGGFYGLGVGEIVDDDAPPPPSIAVTPNADLNGGDVVTITGSGWPPNAAMAACQADVVPPVPPDPPESACLSGQVGAVTTTADANGDWSVPYRLRRQGYVASRGGWIDCADPATPCVLGAGQIIDGAPVGAVATTPLPFAEPPPPPATRGSITVVPSDDLVDGQTLTVTGTGFRASAAIEIRACVAPVTAQTMCAWNSVVDVDADSAGAFSTTVPARQFLFGTTQNCATRPCGIAAFEAVDFDGTFVSVPISFVPPP